MEKTGLIEIKITGKTGNVDINPDNYDIRDIINVLESAENLLYPGDKRTRPTISYSIEEGSVKHVLRTSLQYIIAFNAVIAQVSQKQSIDFLDAQTAKAIEYFQDIAVKKDYRFSFKTSLEETHELMLDKTTPYYRKEAVWADAEFYFYGKVTNAGGKDKVNIHLVTEDLGTIRIDTPKSFLEKYEDNLLYRSFGVRALGKQHAETGEIDTSSLKFIELIDYNPKYDEQYLQSLRDKAKKSWLGKIDPDEWLREMRGGYDA